MPNTRYNKRQRRVEGADKGKTRRTLPVMCLLVTLLAGAVSMSKRGTARATDKEKQKESAVSIQNFTPSTPSKEYIYAGGRLIATEENGSAGGGQGTVFDFEPDNKTEIAFYRNGLWGVLKSTQNYASAQFFSWGGAGLPPIYGDFDGDDKADIGYIVPPSGSQGAVYAILKSSTGYSFAEGQVLFVTAGFPSLGDTPVVGDFDGDGKADPSIWRSSTGVWTIPKSSASYQSFIFAQWGQSGDTPIVCDLDSDGKADIGFYRNGLWGFLKSSVAYDTASPQWFSWGGAGKQAVTGDFDGDGKADLGYVEPPAGGQSAVYAILLSGKGYSFAAGDVLFVPAGFPSLGDTPVLGDWDGDGKTDPGIWRASEGVWIIPLSSTSFASYLFTQWGQNGDIAMPNKTSQ